MRRDDLLDLNEALQHPGRKLSVDISTELPQEADLDLAEPVEGFLEAFSTGSSLLITGHFKTKATLECARCTGPLDVELDFDISEQFPVEGIPSSYSSSDYARVVPDEPHELFDGNSLIVENLLRQAVLLELPVQALCAFGWDGPCPQVAAMEIKAAAEESTSPFAKLKKLDLGAKLKEPEKE